MLLMSLLASAAAAQGARRLARDRLVHVGGPQSVKVVLSVDERCVRLRTSMRAAPDT
jgi:hypothetical protein